MRMYKLIPFFGLFLLLAGGQQLIEWAYAACPPWPYGCCWQSIVVGNATVTNPQAKITTDKLAKEQLFDVVDVSPEVLKAFADENLLGKPVHGFIILTGKKMTGFVPLTRDHKGTEKETSPQQALEVYNTAFEKCVKKQGQCDGNQSSMP